MAFVLCYFTTVIAFLSLIISSLSFILVKSYSRKNSSLDTLAEMFQALLIKIFQNYGILNVTLSVKGSTILVPPHSGIDKSSRFYRKSYKTNCAKPTFLLSHSNKILLKE